MHLVKGGPLKFALLFYNFNIVTIIMLILLLLILYFCSGNSSAQLINLIFMDLTFDELKYLVTVVAGDLCFSLSNFIFFGWFIYSKTLRFYYGIKSL